MQRYSDDQVADDPRLKNKFFYKVNLMKNFAYRYYFSVGNQFVVDNSIPSDKNA